MKLAQATSPLETAQNALHAGQAHAPYNERNTTHRTYRRSVVTSGM